MERSKARALIFWGLAVGVVVADIITKYLAVTELGHQHTSREVFGDWFRLTLVYNRGAAFGLHLGEYSRWIFLVLTIVVLFILARLYRSTGAHDRLRTVALGLVCGGAVGNLIDRVRSSLGVVDFLDVGIGSMRWPTFNVADIAVSTGAFLLAWALWGEEEKQPDTLASHAVPSAKASRGG